MFSTAKTNPARRALFVATLAATAFGFQISQAAAVPNSVKRACISDYFAYCSSHGLGTPALTQCMRRNGYKLSKGCVNGLIKAGYVSRAEVRRQQAKAKRK